MVKFNPLSKDPDEIRKMWYVRSGPACKSGWFLYSRDFVLQTLQGCHRYPEKVKDNSIWRAFSTLIWLGMICTQVVVMIPSYLPILNWGIHMFVSRFPRNAVGFFLRGCYWKTKLKRLGVDTVIDQNVDMHRPDLIEIGSQCHIDRNVILTVGADRGSIIIGDNVLVGPDCRIVGRGGVQIKSFAALSAHVHVYSVTNIPYHPERMGELLTMSHTVPFSQQSAVEAPVAICEYATIGFNTIILPGVTIGFGSIVHAFSEVNQSFADFAIVSGHGRARQQGWRRPGMLDPRLQNESNDTQKDHAVD